MTFLTANFIRIMTPIVRKLLLGSVTFTQTGTIMRCDACMRTGMTTSFVLPAEQRLQDEHALAHLEEKTK